MTFWKPKPKDPFSDWRLYSLFIPSCFSAIGFFVFAVLGYSFTEFSMIPEWTRFWLVLFGGICLACGNELASLTTTIEIFRKRKLGKADTWDNIAIGISLVSTLANFILAFAILLGERANWSEAVQVWGAIAIGILSALDAYAGFLETGYFLADFEERMESWLQEKYDFETEEQEPTALDNIRELVDNLQHKFEHLQLETEMQSWPTLRKQEFDEYRAQANGKLKSMPLEESIELVAWELKRQMPSERTINRWKG